MGQLDRSRLIQERWLSLFRWLFIEAYLFYHYLGGDIGRALDFPNGQLLIAFGMFSLLITILVVVRHTWPIGLAYLTATIDTLVAVFLVAGDPNGVINPMLAGVASASVAVGVRRFPIFETFAFSFIITVGVVATHFYYFRVLPVDFPDILVIGGVAILPVLVRAITLAPQEGSRDDPAARLVARGLSEVSRLPPPTAASAELYQGGSAALAAYTDAPYAGVLVRNGDQSFELHSLVDGRTVTEHLPAQGDESLAARMIAVTEPTAWTRRDDLQTRGLPDQYPGRLDSLLVIPQPNLSDYGAILFAANRKGGAFRPDDRVFGVLVAREIARLYLARTVAHADVSTRRAAMEALLAAIESKRIGSREQAEECARLAVAIAGELGWGPDANEELRIAALLHDIGELAVPDPILDKPAPLLPEEFDIMRQHPRVAARIIDYFNHSPTVLNAVYGHHERWDGRGYPSGLAGDEIPLEARILCLADSVESMLSPKAFRPALDPTDALQEIVKASGTQFDPSVVQAFLAVLQREGPTFLERRVPAPEASPPEWGRSRVG